MGEQRRVESRDVVRLSVAAAASGLVLGLGSRLVMRFVALESGASGAFSVGGSLEVIAFGALLGAPLALLFFLVRPALTTRQPWPGAAWGALVFAAVASVPPPAARSAMTATSDTPSATAAAFALLFVAWGVWLDHLSVRVLTPASRGSPSAHAGRANDR